MCVRDVYLCVYAYVYMQTYMPQNKNRQCFVFVLTQLFFFGRGYSYYIEVSMDQKDWVRVIDHTRYHCRSWQYLYFPARVVRYIRIVGTNNTVNRVFHVVAFEAYYSKQEVKLHKGLIGKISFINESMYAYWIHLCIFIIKKMHFKAHVYTCCINFCAFILCLHKWRKLKFRAQVIEDHGYLAGGLDFIIDMYVYWNRIFKLLYAQTQTNLPGPWTKLLLILKMSTNHLFNCIFFFFYYYYSIIFFQIVAVVLEQSTV